MGQFQPAAIFSRAIGGGVANARDRLAGALARTPIHPNALTLLGLLLALVAAVLLAFGAGQSPFRPGPAHGYLGLAALAALILASICDMLDGALARVAKRSSPSGAFLDSCTDRIADAAIFIGILIYYLRHPSLPYADLFALLAVVALAACELVSYAKARGENFIPAAGIGYWQRGERLIAVCLGLLSGHTATVLFQLDALVPLTAARRLLFAYRQIHRQHQNLPLQDPKAPPTGLCRLLPTTYPRGSLPYDLITAAHIALILSLDAQSLLP